MVPSDIQAIDLSGGTVLTTLTNNVAMVTGAGRGIGRSAALALADHGARVVVVDNGSSIDGSGTSPDIAGATASEIRGRGGLAIPVQADVTSVEDVQRALARVEEEWGGVDILINAAGNYRLATILNITDEAWDSVINVHLRGTMIVTRAVVSSLVRRGAPGRILNFTSLAGTAGLPNQLAYATAKAGIQGFTRALANELFHAGITANAISPGYMTRMAFRGAPAHHQVVNHRDTATALAEISTSGMLDQPGIDPSNITSLIVILVSDAAASISGHTFGANGHRYSRLSEPAEERSVISPDGWTVDELAAIFPSTLGEGVTKPPYRLTTFDVVEEADVSADRVAKEFSDSGRTAEAKA